MRRLVERQADAEDQRTTLARYFSPDVIEEFAVDGAPMLEPRSHEAVIVFMDLVGFTRAVEHRPPREILEMLREYHRVVVPTVFKHGGSVDKYLGDGLMITFGALHPSSSDADDAVRFAHAALDKLELWNRERSLSGRPRLESAVGIHAGQITSGNIGDDERLEFTVIGDAVNVASRIERMTRSIGTRLLVSDAVVRRLHPELAGKLIARGTQRLRGRSATIDLWMLP
jgi:adenylate cyclase